MSTKKNNVDSKILADIKETGWHVILVAADEEGPGFAYSIGLYETFGHPEIIIIGLQDDLAHRLINNMGEDVRNKKKYTSGNFYPGILDDFKCFLLTVSVKKYEEYVGYARWYYKGDNFPLLQCIFPTVTGKYPWQWPRDKKHLQPVLGKRSAPKKNNSK